MENNQIQAKLFWIKFWRWTSPILFLLMRTAKRCGRKRCKSRHVQKMEDDRKNAEQRHKPRYHEGRGKRLKRYGNGWTEQGRAYYQELLKTFWDLKSSVFWEKSLQGYWNAYQIKNYRKSRINCNNTESESDKDTDETEDNWKVEAEETDSEIDAGDMSDKEVEHRMRARRF
jgi:hypothetical protein